VKGVNFERCSMSISQTGESEVLVIHIVGTYNLHIEYYAEMFL